MCKNAGAQNLYLYLHKQILIYVSGKKDRPVCSIQPIHRWCEQELHYSMTGCICNCLYSKMMHFECFASVVCSQTKLKSQRGTTTTVRPKTQPYLELCNSFRHVFLTYGGFILMFQRILLWIHELLEFTQVQKVVTVFCCNSNNSFDLKRYANMDGGNKWMLLGLLFCSEAGVENSIFILRMRTRTRTTS